MGRGGGLAGTCVILALGAQPSFAGAQVPVHVQVVPQIGYMVFNGEDDVEVNEDGVLYQLRLGVQFTKHWSVEGSFGLTVSDFPPEDDERRSFFLQGTGVYAFSNPTRLTPFLAGGVEMLAMDTSLTGDKASLALVWGGGLDLAVSRRISLRVDGRQHHFRVNGEDEFADRSLWLDHFDVGVGIAWKPWE